jgi:hypothetical protein
MDERYCNICSKKYKSYKSLWNHNKNFHNNDTSKNNIIQHTDTTKTNIIHQKSGKYNCKYCSKEFTFSQSKYRHEAKCKDKNTETIIKENKLLKQELVNINKTMEEFKKQMIQIMNKQYKMHPKTLEKINKQLNINITSNTINNICSNNTINIIQLGDENLDTVLTQTEQLNILSKNSNLLEYMIKYVHFNNKYPQFKNIMITNQQNNIAYRYDNCENKFVATNKNDLVDELISCRTADIEEFLDNNINMLEQKTITKIKEFIKKITYDDKYDEHKKKQVKLLIYNNRDKLTKEIYQDLELIV